MDAKFFKLAVVYLAIGICMGLVMGVTENFTFAPVHAHINLLGWASLALAGAIYRLYPRAAQSKLAKVHFWLHNLGLPVFMVLLFLLLSGHKSLAPVVGIAATITGIGILVFVVNVLLNVKSLSGAGNQSGHI